MKLPCVFASTLILGLLLVSVDARAQKPAEPPMGPIPKKLPMDPIPEKPPTDTLFDKLTKADPKDDGLRKLQKDRCKEAHEVVRLMAGRIGNVAREDYASQVANLESAKKRLREACSELIGTPEARIELLKENLESALAMEKKYEKDAQGGIGAPYLVNQARYSRLDAEIELLKAQREFEKTGKK